MNSKNGHVTPPNLRQPSIDDDIETIKRLFLNEFINEEIRTISYKEIRTGGGFDRLELTTTEEINVDWIKENCKESPCRISTDYGYSRNFLINKTDYSFTVRRGGRGPVLKNQICIEFNPNQFVTYKKYNEYLRKILGYRAIFNHKLSRLDMAILLETKYFPKVFLKAIMRVYDYQSTLRVSSNTMNTISEKDNRKTSEILYGVSGTRQVAIYERECEKSSDERMTNLEIRLWGKEIKKKLHITSAFDLDKIRPGNFINGLLFYDIFEPIHLPPNSVAERRFLELMIAVIRNGMSEGIRDTRSYKNNKFDRDYQDVIKEMYIGKEIRPLLFFLKLTIEKNLSIFTQRQTKEKQRKKNIDFSGLRMTPIFNTATTVS